MQSASSRLNTILMMAGTLLFALAMLNHIHGRLLYAPHPSVSFQMRKITSFRELREWDSLSFKYDLAAGTLGWSIDLSSLYNWNLKQAFLYIEAEWEHEKDGKTLSSRMILSDWILDSPSGPDDVSSAYSVNVTNKSVEYQLRDVYKQLRGRRVKISLRFEYMPMVGLFFKDTLKEIELDVPAQYLTN